MDRLKKQLLTDFSKQSLRVDKIIAECHRRKYIYTSANIKRAIELHESEGRAKVDIPASRRKTKGDMITLGKERIVTF